MEHSSPELTEVATMLEEHRARLTDAEFDHIRRRATSSRPAVASATTRRGPAMRSRAAITSMLAAGFLMTGGGAALGVSALSDTQDAKTAQYGVTSESTGSGGAVTDDSAANAGAGDSLGAQAQGQGAPAGQDAGRSASNPVQPARQLETGGSELPFTGYVSGFVLLIGLGTLAAGLVLRRGLRHAPLS